MSQPLPTPLRDAEGVPLMRNGERNPSGPGRYCLRVCYCGGCPQYEPLPEVASVVVEPSSSNAQQAQSWANRDEPTWLDR